jgi:hypothetical protein
MHPPPGLDAIPTTAGRAARVFFGPESTRGGKRSRSYYEVYKEPIIDANEVRHNTT